MHIIFANISFNCFCKLGENHLQTAYGLQGTILIFVCLGFGTLLLWRFFPHLFCKRNDRKKTFSDIPVKNSKFPKLLKLFSRDVCHKTKQDIFLKIWNWIAQFQPKYTNSPLI